MRKRYDFSSSKPAKEMPHIARLQAQGPSLRTLHGTCLCGGIEFEVDELPGLVFNCHCSRCRKAHGAAFASLALANRATLRFLRGRELLAEYDSSAEGIRAFCSRCGSRLMNYQKDDGPYLGISIACLDGYEGRPTAHCFIDSKAPWHEPPTDIPAFGGLPDGMG